MNTYNSFFITFRGRPFLNILCEKQDAVEQFIVDYCQSKNLRPVADEWAIEPNVPAVVSRDTVDQIFADTGRVPGATAAQQARTSKWQCVPGDVGIIRPNSKMWG